MAALVLSGILILPLMVLSQTPVKAPSNPYKPEKDVELGQQAATEIERQLPLVENREVQAYIARVGRRLVDAIPAEFQNPSFRYSFKVVNARDINAFALPGGPTYVNRGLIEAANNEGELAGVLAHETCHVVLRHGTAQVAKAQKYSILGAIGQIAGAVIGGAAGGAVSQGSQFGVGAYFLKFSREYEKQADILGSRIMANAGYDPRDLANMFRTIERESGGGGPQWLSSHPNPGNRYEYINKEAQILNVSDPIQNTQGFSRAKAILRDLPRARTMAEISRGGRVSAPSGNEQPVGERVDYPSNRYRTYTAGNVFRVAVPDNWRELPAGDEVTFAPEGAYGEIQGRFVFTHGAIVGVTRAQGNNLRQATDSYIRTLAANNPNIRQQSGYTRGVISGRNAISVLLSNVSEVTRRSEAVVLYTTLLRNGDLFYMIGVSPEQDFRQYERTFQQMLRSIQVN
jgi:hypothetical protein